MDNKILSAEEIAPVVHRLRDVLQTMDKVLLGQHQLHQMVLVCLMSRGHCLLEGPPGVGKTQLVKTLSSLLGLSFARVQFTPDLMPSDIVGSTLLQGSIDSTREFVFEKGPVFTHLLLADEINRASPKTQSALLEAMQERQVTVFGKTYHLPEPFFVMASQNPIEMQGVYPLPEAQLDRFLFKLEVPQVERATLQDIISTRRHGKPPEVETVLDAQSLQRIFETLERMYLPGPIAAFISALTEATHRDSALAPQEVKEFVQYGVSPRAAIGLAEASRAKALLEGRPSVGYEDVLAVLHPIFSHRIILNYKAKLESLTMAQLLSAIVQAVNDAELGPVANFNPRIGKAKE